MKSIFFKFTVLFAFVFIIFSCNMQKQGQKSVQAHKAYKSEQVSITTPDGVRLYGTLVVPNDVSKPPVVLIIAGSGPTDRDGNQPSFKSNIYKILADSLANHGIASLRYDKRGIGQSKVKNFDESKLTIDTYVSDAAQWIKWLKNSGRFSSVIVAGHSEGSLIGILAIEHVPADMFISLEGAGRPIDQVLKEQLKTQPKYIINMAYPIIDSLKVGKQVKDVPKLLYALFRPSVQPYLISWMKYDPAKELSKLNIPILIIQGTTDLQVSLQDAKRLASANPKAKLVIINGMNHMLRNAPMERLKNLTTYTKPDLPLNKQLITSLVQFIKSH